MAIGAAVGIVLMAAVAHLLRPVYLVTLTVTPTSSNTSSTMRSLGTLTSVLGVSNPLGNRSDPFDYYIYGLTSRVAAEGIVADQPLMRRLFEKDWSEETHSWRHNPSVIRTIARGAAALLGFPSRPWHPPDATTIHDMLTQAVQVDTDKKTRITKISMQSKDPALIGAFLMRMHRSVDGYLRDRTMRRATDYIGYINKELQKVTVAEYRTALVDTASEQEKLRMAASSGAPFVAEPFGDPVASTKPVGPNVPLILFAGLFLGAIAGAGYGFVKERASGLYTTHAFDNSGVTSDRLHARTPYASPGRAMSQEIE